MPKTPLNIFNFWNELKRRKVVKASLVYLAVAFGILQAADIIFPALGLPQWTITFVLILLIIVFILVLVLTWVYDITPEGIRVTQDEEQKSREKDKIAPVKDLKSDDSHKDSGIVADESELQKKVQLLEKQLQEERKRSAGSIVLVSLRKFAFPVVIVGLLLLVVFFKEDIVQILGFGDERRELAMAHNSNAVHYINNGDYESARKELDLALESDPDYSYAWGNMAVVSYRLGDPGRAVIEATKAMSLDPKNSKAPYNLAFALDDRKDYTQAIRWYKAAVRIDSLYSQDSVYTAACSALGYMYNTLNQPVDAVLILNRALEKYPQSKHLNLVYKNLGNAYLLQEQPDSALKYLLLSRGLKPEEPETNRLLAMAYEKSGQISESIEHWEAYINLETDTAKIRWASVHRKELAVRQLQEIIRK